MKRSFGLLLLMSILAGCAGHAKDITYGVAAQSGLQTVQSKLIVGSDALNASNAELAKLAPNLSAIGTNNKTAIQAIADAQALIPTISKYISDATASYDALAKKYNALQNDWLGPKARRSIDYLLIIGGLFVVGIIALQLAPTVGVPVLANLSLIVGHVLTLGMGLVSKGIAKILGWLVNKTASAVTSTAIVAPVTITMQPITSTTLNTGTLGTTNTGSPILGSG